MKTIGRAALPPVFLLLALGGLFGGLWTMRSSDENLSVLNHGKRTTGTIINRDIDYGSGQYGSEDSVHIEYTFTLPSGQEIVGSYRFWPATPAERNFSGINVGDRIEIVYDPQNPSKNLPANLSFFNVSGVESAKKLFGWFYIIGSSLLLGGLIIWLGNKTWRVWRLSKYRVS